MSFAPAIPLGGIAGLRFLDRTFDRQIDIFSKSPELQRDIEHFRAVAPGIDSAEALVQDTRALRVALGAFGLEDELPKRAFIRKVLEEGTLDPRAFANRLADPAWARFAGALGFGDLGGRLGLESAREDLIGRFRIRQFERATGEQDVNLRLAMNFRREIATIASSDAVDRAGWFRVLGSQPLRQVVESAFGLPDGFGALDIEEQRLELERLTRRRYGEASPAAFRDAGTVDDVLRRFLLRADLASGPSAQTRGMAALTILQSAPIGPAASANLFASRFL